MRNLNKKCWEKPLIKGLDIKNNTLSGVNIDRSENTSGNNNKRPS
jgi:hypothetical protein